MSTQTLIVALSRGSEALRKLANEAESVKVASQLIGLGITFYDLVTQLRSGKLRLSAEATQECIEEVEEANSAAHEAQSKTDAERALGIVEAIEAVNLIYANAQAPGTNTVSHYSALLGGTRPIGISLPPDHPPWPYPLPGPRPWPLPRPLPRPWPWPWPPGPGPWPDPWTWGEFDVRDIDRWR